MKKQQPRTLVAIAKLLNADGFTPTVAAAVRRYNKTVMPKRIEARHDRAREAFSKMVKEKLSHEDRLILGHYLNVFARSQFDAGLKMGLMTNLNSEKE